MHYPSIKPIKIIMVSYYRPRDLHRSVMSILENTVHPYILTIIDNSSGSIPIDYPVKIVKSEKNLGKGKAFMDCYRRNNDRYVVSIDADIVVSKGWLTKLVASASIIEQTMKFGLLAPAIIDNDHMEFNKPLYMHRGPLVPFDGHIYQSRHTAGPLFLIGREFFDRVGGYCTSQIYGIDDGRLCSAAVQHGYFVGIASNVAVEHSSIDIEKGYIDWKKRNIRIGSTELGYYDQ